VVLRVQIFLVVVVPLVVVSTAGKGWFGGALSFGGVEL